MSGLSGISCISVCIHFLWSFCGIPLRGAWRCPLCSFLPHPVREHALVRSLWVSSVEAVQSQCSHLLPDRCSHLCCLTAACPCHSYWELRTESGTGLTSVELTVSLDMLFVLSLIQLRTASNFTSWSTLTTTSYSYFFPYAWKIGKYYSSSIFSFYTGFLPSNGQMLSRFVSLFCLLSLIVDIKSLYGMKSLSF